MIVTSGAYKRNRKQKDRYYALVCSARHSNCRSSGGELNARALRNIGGKVVGSSQVTAVVERVQCQDTGHEEGRYRIDARAALTPPYCANLIRPRILTAKECRLLDEIGEDGKTADDWLVLVRKIRCQD